MLLQRGDSGYNVKRLQAQLILLQYNCGSSGADGIFGAGTESAVRTFQSHNGLNVDGLAGNNTLNTLYNCLITGYRHLYIRGKLIKVAFKHRMVSIDNDYNVKQLYKTAGYNGIAELASEILSVYDLIYNKDLNISYKSLIVEIIGHLDLERYAKWFGKYGKPTLKRTEEIDCGESPLDENRPFWNVLEKLV